MAIREGRAHAIILQVYGSYVRSASGQVVLLPDQAAMNRKVDEVYSRQGLMGIKGKPWKAGTAEEFAKRGNDIGGFADKTTNVTYVIDSDDLPSTTVHELLHVHESPGWTSGVGHALHEGMTELLALNALLDKRVRSPVAKDKAAYPKERSMVTLLQQAFGPKILRDGYFNGPEQLIREYEALPGGKWRALTAAMDKFDRNKVISMLSKKKPDAALM